MITIGKKACSSFSRISTLQEGLLKKLDYLFSKS
jgi:hypothetical protein